MSVKQSVFALGWWSNERAGGQSQSRGQMERFPAHSRVVLPDGRIMLVRMASLAAAKDMLAAQRAARVVAAPPESGAPGASPRVAATR